jgi:hypothetical protein
VTKQERDHTTMLLGGLAEVLGQELTTARLALLLEDLDDVPFERIQVGIQRARRECKFIPAPVELRALCRRQETKPLGPALPALLAERQRVKETWKGGPPVPTLDEMVKSCYENACLAEKQAEAVRAAIDRRMPGDPDLKQLHADLERHRSDYRHWSDYVGHYRSRVAKEGGTTVPLVTLPGARP